MYFYKISIVCLISVFIISCSVNKSGVQNFKYSYCSSKLYHQADLVSDSLYQYKYISESGLSEYNKLMCQILGVSKEVDELLKLKKMRNDKTHGIQILEHKQEITQKISLAKTDLDAFISELDCEGERADLAANYLDDSNDKRNTKLTVGSVILGALTTVATVLFKDDNSQTAVGVSGGLVSAGLGALTIKPKGKRLEFYHSKNILTPVWTGVNDGMYPEFIWNIFNVEEFNEESSSLQESTKGRWVKFVLNDEINSTEESLFFGEGGEYTAEYLHMRSEMIDQVKSSARYVNQLLSMFESSLYNEYKK